MGQDLVRKFITAEYQDSVREVLLNALTGEETANYELPLYTKDGRRVEVLLNATTRRNVGGAVTGVVGVGQDITEMNRGKQELHQVANALTRLIDTANAPIFGIDDNGLVNEWNRKTASITGFRYTPPLPPSNPSPALQRSHPARVLIRQQRGGHGSGPGA